MNLKVKIWIILNNFPKNKVMKSLPIQAVNYWIKMAIADFKISEIRAICNN